MLKEIDFFGVYLAPFSAYLILAVLLFVPLRALFDRIEIQRYVWHRQLFDVAAFVALLSLIGLLL